MTDPTNTQTTTRREYVLGYTQVDDYTPGNKRCRVTVEMELRRRDQGTELSICGNVWNSRGSDIEMGGQCVDKLLSEIKQYAKGVNALTVTRIEDIWKRWHLNGMRAGCEHQRAEWDTTAEVELVTYRLTSEAQTEQRTLKAHAMRCIIDGAGKFKATPEELALLRLPWETTTAPDADGPGSGQYEVNKRETKTVNWLRESEHPLGILCKPCGTCGYKYGSRWLFEELPQDIIDEVTELMARLPVFGEDG